MRRILIAERTICLTVLLLVVFLFGCVTPKHVIKSEGTPLGEKFRRMSVSELCEVASTSQDTGMRSCALGELGIRADAAATSTLLEILRDSTNGLESCQAAVALGNIGDVTAFRGLTNIYYSVQTSDFLKANVVCWALGLQGSERAVPALLDALQHKDTSVRGYAAKALGEIGDRGALEFLITVFKHDDCVVVRQYAAIALALLGDETGKPMLRSLIEGKDPALVHSNGFKIFAAVALSYLNDPCGLAVLQGEASKPEACYGFWAAVGITKLKDKSGIPILISLIGMPHDPSSYTKRDLFKSLQEATGKSFGNDKTKWQEWWKENKDTFEFKDE